jgi:c(7)-type cytochrome triheme protein
MNRCLLMIIIASLLLTGQALAVAPGMLLEFSNNPQGKVLFDGTVHQEAGFSCPDCHNDWLFPKMKQGATTISMAEIDSGRLCGGCHNGDQAFAPEGNCDRCHIKNEKP